MAGKINGLCPFSVEGGTSNEALESLTSWWRLGTAMGTQTKELMKEMPQVLFPCLVREGSQSFGICVTQNALSQEHI